MASNFQRSPSKVWWAQSLDESPPSDWHNRTGNGSPSSHKSQDSGFSDSEISPTLGTTVVHKPKDSGTPKSRYLTEAILKDISSSNTPKNLTENLKEKHTTKKSISKFFTDIKKSDQRINERHNVHCRSLPSTPKNHRRITVTSKSVSQVPSPTQSPHSFHRKLSIFNAESKNNDTEIKSEGNSRSFLRVNRNLLNYFREENNLNSLSLPTPQQPTIKSQFNATIPPYYQYNLDKIERDFANSSSDSIRQSDSEASVFDTSNEVVTSESFSYQDDQISDCEKEIESFFPDKLESPVHTSTPKTRFKKSLSPLRRKIAKQKKYNLYETFEKIPETNPMLLPQFPPVKCWLNEVEQLYEPECMTTLQSKSIANDLARHVSQLAENLTNPIREMLKHSRIIIKEFNKMKIQLERNKMHHIGPLTQSLVGNITEFVLKNMINSQGSSLVDAKQTKLEIHNLLELSSSLRQEAMNSAVDIEKIYNLISNLQDIFYKTEHNILMLKIQLLVNAVEDSSSHLSLRASLFGLTSLAVQCERLSDMIVAAGGPRVLLILCVECRASTIRTMALRTLATVCCSTSAIRQLEQADGVDVLADILSDGSRPEPELSEATSVLTQITAPWIEDNHSVRGLTENIATIVTAITNFLEKTKCCQNLLLCSAALANITYMSVNAVGPLIQNNTIEKLLEAVRNRGPRASVFLKEQTATLIANLSDVPESREHLAENNAGVALLCFLQIYPINLENEAQCNAAQRLQQKSAIALSRLCSNIKVAQQIVELGGVTRIVQLCKEGKERNNSDAVLVACLATLRKIVANCGNEVMDQKDIMELVEPRLLDSFLAYSAQNESYV